MAESSQPLASAREGSISIAIFDGQFGKTAVVQKSYLKKGGDPKKKEDWVRSQINLFLNELTNLKAVTDTICTEMADEIKKATKPKE